MSQTNQNKIINILTNDGVGGLIKKLLVKIYKKQQLLLMGYDLTSPQKKYKKTARYILREVTIEDIDKFDKYLVKYKNDYRDLFAIGCKVFGALDVAGENLICVASTIDKDFYDAHYQKCTFSVGPSQIYQFAGEVAAPFRGSSIAAHVPFMMWQYWRERGKTQTYCSVDVKNIASVRYHLHLGFYEMGESITTHRLLGIKWSTRSKYSGEKLTQYRKKKRVSSNADEK